MLRRVTAYRWVPPFAAGLVRDHRVRWALEEAGLPYEERLIDVRDKPAEHLREQPFGQVPVYQEGDLVLFESGAIVHHIAESSPALMPSDPHGRAHTTMWLFAALNTIEPPIWQLVFLDEKNDARPKVVEQTKRRLDQLATALGDRPYLVGDRFTAADLMMTSVLRILRSTDLVEKVPALDAYKKRHEARPAFQKSLAAQLAPFEKNAPPATSPSP